MTQIAYTSGTVGTIKGGARRYDAPNGKDVGIDEPKDVDRPLLFLEDNFVAFHSAQDDVVLYVKETDIKASYIGIPDDLIHSVTDRVLRFISNSVKP